MTKNKILLATEKKRIAARVLTGRNIGKKMEADPDGAVAAKGTQLRITSEAIKNKREERSKLQSQAKGLTGQLKKLRKNWGKHYKAAADKAQEIYPEDSGKWLGYGFNLADTEPSDRHAPPKVKGLQVIQGAAAGKADLVWNPQPRSANDGYFIEVNPNDSIDPGAWTSASPRSVSASKVTIKGLTTGKKYWVRIIAYLSKGTEGPASSPVAFIAP